MANCSTAVKFPDNAKVNVDGTVAREILAAAEHLPQYDNREFYSTDLQTYVLNSVRESCPKAFDAVIAEIKQRLARWPYCALIQGLSCDDGNRVFVAINRAFGELVARPYEKPRAQLVH